MGTAADRYLRELGARLRAPGRVRRGLLAEAAGHLEDATDDYVARGLDQPTAEARALADFGTVDEIAPAFRTTLAVAASRRTAWLFLAAVLPQAFLWDSGLELSAKSRVETPDTALFAALDMGIEMVGMVVIAGTVLAIAATGVGNRWFHAGRRVARATAVCALVGALVVPVTGLTMMTLAAGTDLTLYAYAGALMVAPMLLVVLSARRCLTVA